MSSAQPEVEVLLMAGGEGRRLGKLTSRTPKPMLPVNGEPVLRRLLEQLRDQGVGHAFVSVRHLSHVITDYFGDGRWLGIDIEYVVESRPLDTAGALGLLPTLSRPLLVVNGDLVTCVPVAALAEQHAESRAALTVGCAEHRMHVPYGVVEGRWPELGCVIEKPDVVLRVVAGIYLVAPDVVADVPVGCPLSMPRLMADLVGRGRRVVGFALPGPWVDMGTPEAYARLAQADAVTSVPPATERSPTVWIPTQRPRGPHADRFGAVRG